MYLEFYWYYLLPVLLTVPYSCMRYRIVPVRNLPAWKVRLYLSVLLLAEAALILAWLSAGFPLPLFYGLVYLIQAVSTYMRKNVQMKFWFFLNLNFVNIMVLHMTFIGVAALVRDTAMYKLIADAAWRTASVCFVLAVCIVENLIFLYRPRLFSLLVAEAESEEARAFMAFLSFCTGYLLLDSLLCEAELATIYPALFLIGSSAVLTFCLIRFLIRIHTIMREEYLKKEHNELSARLESARESAGSLRRMAERDALTGAFSRRYLLDYIDKMIEGGQLFSLVFIDLDDLKLINDREGHNAGDHYLIRFTKGIDAALGDGCLLFRVGGDEFIVLMPDIESDEAGRRMKVVREALETGRWERPTRFSYGITAYLPEDTREVADLLKEADQAMYEDKISRR